MKYKNYGDNSGGKIQYKIPNLPLMQCHHYNNRIIPSPNEDKINTQVVSTQRLNILTYLLFISV